MNFSFRIPYLTVKIAAIALLVSCTHSATPEPDAAEELSVLRVGNEADFPPFSQKNADGTLTGIDIDVANAICEKMEVECEFVINEWSSIIPSLNAGKYDVIISSVSITDERQQQVLFSKPYLGGNEYAIVAEKGVTLEPTAEGLAGRKICVIKNSSSVEWLETYAPEAEILQYDGSATAKTDLLAGRCDGWMEGKVALYSAVIDTPEGENYDFAAEFDNPIGGGEAGIAARLGEEELIARINQAIDEIYADGTFEQINEKYLPFDISAEEFASQ